MSGIAYVGADGHELSIVFNSFLDECCEQNTDLLISRIDEASDATVQELKSTSPRGKSRKNHYWRGWTKTRKRIDRGLGGIFVVVHNKNKPTLTSLLEHGHDIVIGGTKAAGGRIVGRVKAYPHIKKAEQHALEMILRGR